VKVDLASKKKTRRVKAKKRKERRKHRWKR